MLSIINLPPTPLNQIKLTFSRHEIVQKGVPVPWVWLDLVHAVEVEIGHHIVLCVTSHIDDLHREKTECDVF